jgi:lysophospholipase L1-like esterase
MDEDGLKNPPGGCEPPGGFRFVLRYNQFVRRTDWLILLATCIVLSACADLAKPQSISDLCTPKDTHTMRYLALGDSYTIGESVDPSERWPAQLTARLRERGFTLADPIIIATTGWTTDELSHAIVQTQPLGPFDLVTLLIGVNNQYRGRSEDEYRQQFHALLQRASAYAGNDPARVIVLSIPDWSVTPFASALGAEESSLTRIARQIDRLNAINRVETERSGARYIDITSISREAARDRSLLAGDGLHPSGKMYAAWVQLIEPIACEGLSH